MSSEQVPTHFSLLVADPATLRGWVNDLANGDALANYSSAIQTLLACADKITELQVALGKEKQAVTHLSLLHKELSAGRQADCEVLETYQAELAEHRAELEHLKKVNRVAWALACELAYPVVIRICDRYGVVLTNPEESDA